MGLEIERARRFHHWEVTAQRVGILVLAGLLVAAALGVFGGAGPLSSTVQSGPDGAFSLSYHRFLHRGTTERLTVTVAAGTVTGDHLDLELAAGWLARVQVEAVVPEPDSQTSTADAVRYRFSAEPGTSLVVHVTFWAAHVGGLDGWVAVVPGERTAVTQYVYP